MRPSTALVAALLGLCSLGSAFVVPSKGLAGVGSRYGAHAPCQVRPGRACLMRASPRIGPANRAPARTAVVVKAAEPQAQERKGISEDDPLVLRIREDVLRETGVELDQLLNPGKVRSCGIVC